MRLLTALFSVTMCATCVFGQNSISTNLGPEGFSGSAHFGPSSRYSMRAVTGAPYSGEEVSEHVQTLADGTRITRKSSMQKVFRDSMGRTRTERPMFNGGINQGRMPEAPTIIEITDPIAQVRYTLDVSGKVAHRQQLAAAPTKANRTPAVSTISREVSTTTVTGIGSVTSAGVAIPESERPQMSNEKLGNQTMDGVLVEGTRHTTTYPIGSQGNDRPFSMVSEMWMSPELKVTVLSKFNDPRNGEQTMKLTGISRTEPSSTLFQPPPEYTVVDEAGEFTIKWGSQQ